MTGVAALSDNLEHTLRREAKSLLGGDLAVRGSRPIPAEIDEVVTAESRAEVRELATMAALPPDVSAGGPRSLLVELKAVGGGWPLYGAVEPDPDAPLEELLADGGALVGRGLVEGLGIEIGDHLAVGNATLVVRGVVVDEPDRIVSPFTLGPRVLVSAESFSRTELETFGSRIDYRRAWRLAGDPTGAEVDRIAEGLRAALEGSPAHRVETYREAQPSVREGLRRTERFLGLLALLSLLVGAVGVGQSIRSLLASRLDAVAVMKCLGMRPREAYLLFLGQCLLVGLVGGTAGALVGLGVQALVPLVPGSLIPAEAVTVWQPAALVRGIVLTVLASGVFVLSPLAAVLRVPPLRALRRDASPLPPSRVLRLAVGLAVVAGLVVVALIQIGIVRVALLVVAVLLAAAGALAVAAEGVRRVVALLARRRLPFVLRQGAAFLVRPGREVSTAILALGVGVLVVLTTVLVERSLVESLAAELPSDAPTAFLVDIQPDQWPGVRATLEDSGATEIDSVPVIMARLSRVDGVPVEDLAENSNGDRRWALTREQRLTFLHELPPDNTLVAGTLWGDPSLPEASLEEDFAAELGVGLGDSLTFDVQGVPVRVVVTSLRRVDWRGFRINFFIVVEPEVLADAPRSRLAAARLPGSSQPVQDRITATAPNVTVIDIRAVLDKVLSVLRRLALGVRVVGGFTALAGVAILFGAVAAGSARRSRDVALFKTLGATRRDVAAIFAAEYALVGCVAGTVGSLGAIIVARLVAVSAMEIEPAPATFPALAAVVLTVLLTTVAGLSATAPALRRKPLDVLRRERE